MGVEEERHPGNELINLESGANAPVDVFESIAQSERQFLDSCRPRFTNVITANRDRVITGYTFGAEFESVDHQLHRRTNRVDPFLLRNVLLQNVVLQSTGDFCPIS